MDAGMRTEWTPLLRHIMIGMLGIALASALCICGFANSVVERGEDIGDHTDRTTLVVASSASIQEAINNASNGDTILVMQGTYYERVVVNKTVSLVAEDRTNAIIDGSNGGTVVEVTADHVNVTGFTIRYSGWGWYNNGILIQDADYCELRNNYFFTNCHNIRLNGSRSSRVIGNTIDGNGYGIRLLNCCNCIISGNDVYGCIGGIHLDSAANCTVSRNYFARNSQGIRFYSPCVYNKFYENTVCNNTYDGMIEVMPGNATLLGNLLFHNNFINNTNPFIYETSSTIWDNGYPSGGNYWSRHSSADLCSGAYQNETGPDGICDTSYAVNAYDNDRFPLAHPYGSVRNLDTNVTYLTIQSAINAQETSSGDTIFVRSGIYNEHVTLNKTLRLVGENQSTTIVHGNNIGTVVAVKADNVSFAGFTVENGGSNYPPYGNDCGVLIDHCVGSNISHNLIVGNRIGLYLYFSRGNVIEHNSVFSNSEDGICLWYSGNNVLRENQILGNRFNFGVFGNDFSCFDNLVDADNTVDGKSIYYQIGSENEVIDNLGEVGVIYLVNCHNVTVRNLSLSKNSHGFFGYNATDCTIENVTATENKEGICIQGSSGNVIRDNLCRVNWVGIHVEGSNDILVDHNMVETGEKAISLYEADNNTLRGNTLQSALYGIRLFSSDSNRIFHNNLIGNSEQVDLLNSYQNSWDNGFEGNFWSDHYGPDSDRNGIVDNIRIIDDQNYDGFPLMGFFYVFRANMQEVFASTNSTIVDFKFIQSNATIRMIVTGPNETLGLFRMQIPKALIEHNVTVVVDDGLTEVLYANYNLLQDSLYQWIYFECLHSSHEITIIPESGPALLLSGLLGAIACLFLRKRGNSSLFQHT